MLCSAVKPQNIERAKHPLYWQSPACFSLQEFVSLKVCTKSWEEPIRASVYTHSILLLDMILRPANISNPCPFFLKGSKWSWIYTNEEYVGWHFKIQAEELCYHPKWYSTSMGLLLNAIGIILLNIVKQTWKEKLPKHSFKNSFCQKTLESVRCKM